MKATSALPQLTVEHFGGCLVTEGVTQGKGYKTISILPTEQNYPLLTQVVGHVSAMNPAENHQIPPKERKSLWERSWFCSQVLPDWTPLSLSGKEIVPGTKGRQSHFHCLAKSKDSKDTGLCRHENEQVHWFLIIVHVFGPPARLGGASGGVNTLHTLQGTTQWVHSEKFFLFNIKPQAETQSCYTRQLQDCGFFILFYCFPGLQSYLSTGTCRATNAYIQTH